MVVSFKFITSFTLIILDADSEINKVRSHKELLEIWNNMAKDEK